MGGLGTPRIHIGKGMPVLDFALREIGGIRCQVISIFWTENINKSAEGQVLAESEESMEKWPGKIWQGVSKWLT